MSELLTLGEFIRVESRIVKGRITFTIPIHLTSVPTNTKKIVVIRSVLNYKMSLNLRLYTLLYT